MKKTYIIPTCEIVKFNPTDIIATSDTLPVNDITGQYSRSGRTFFDFDDDFFEE